jgi:uncharacterized protein (TIGR02145 family)
LDFGAANCEVLSWNKAYGSSIRCIKDSTQTGQTSTIPTITTTTISNINQTTATGGGNVTDDGGATLITMGVCWNTSATPTTANGHTTQDAEEGVFTSDITGLTEGTLYYVRAYATNSVGTAYGNQQSFTTLDLSCPGEPTVTYGGQIYHTVQIGTQCWFKENLNIGTPIDVSQEQTNNGTIEKYCYDNLVSNCNVYGGLYQWNEVMQYVTNEGAPGICPDGWHIPTDAEWTTLTTYLGGEIIAGGKMKEAGLTHWASPNAGATNSSGFTALPGGFRGGNGWFGNLSQTAGLWSSSQSGGVNSWFRNLYWYYEYVYTSDGDKSDGLSVRCVQD